MDSLFESVQKLSAKPRKSHQRTRAKLTSSSVFESMLSSDPNYLQGSPMELGDELKDHSIIYGALMDVLYPTPYTRLLDLHKVNVILHLIDLAELWSIEKVYRVIVKDIRYELSYRHFDLFLIAIKLKDYNLAANIIKQCDKDEGLQRLGSDIFPPLQTTTTRLSAQCNQSKAKKHQHYLAKIILSDDVSTPKSPIRGCSISNHANTSISSKSLLRSHGLYRGQL
jgi:hypothetical protein